MIQSKTILFLFSITFFGSLIACGGGTPKKAQPTVDPPPVWESLYKDVMVVHDEVMPETSTINKLKRQVSTYLARNEGQMEVEEKDMVKSLIVDLGRAEESMFDWMNQFKKPKKNSNEEEATLYLEQELIKITEVSNLMKGSIINAQNFVNGNDQ